MNWKAAAKYFYHQFLLWVKAYNEIADIYMIDTTTTSNNAVTYQYQYTFRGPETGG
jgi:hypothetical protein